MQSDGFIREVDEELQRDRMAALWKRYGPIAVTVAVIVVAGTAGKVGWDAWQKRQLDAQAAAFAAAEAQREGNAGEAARLFGELAVDLGGEAAVVARLREAEAEFAADETEAARTTLESVAFDDDADSILTSAAAVAAGQRSLGAGLSEPLRSTLEAQLDGQSPFRHSVRELLALDALKAGDEDRSVTLLRELMDDATAPTPLRQRSTELLAALGVEVDPEGTDETSADEDS